MVRVGLSAEAGAGRDAEHAVLVRGDEAWVKRCFEPRVEALGPAPAGAAGERHRAQKLQGREPAGAEIGRVRHHGDAMALGQREHLEELGHAAHLGHARLHVAHRAGIQHAAELDGGARILAAGEVDSRFLLKPGQRRKILRREDRLLQPMEIVSLEPFRHRERHRRSPRAVRVRAERHVGPHGLACRRDLGLARLVQLDGGIAFVQRGTHGGSDQLAVPILEQAGVAGNQRRRGRPAEELPERQPRPLAREVPERDVDGGDAEHGDAVAAEEVQRLLQLAVERGDVGRVAPDEDGRHRRVDDRLERRHAVVAEAFAPAGGAVLGLDPDQQNRKPLPRLPAPGRRRPAVVVRDGEGDGFDAGDLHGGIPNASRGPGIRGGRRSGRGCGRAAVVAVRSRSGVSARRR